ncbi:sensor domain-containing diguanylate cyclase [Shewanella sp.]|uniref:sensor domain-containing diguanylate cyclase n=1 Tax=Shewanella sp. TaxID=50422 RepID=UPI003D121CE1
MMMFRSFIIFVMMCCWQAAEASEHKPLMPFVSAISYLQDDSVTELSLAQVQQRFQNGDYIAVAQPLLTFGINRKTAWVRLSITNPTSMQLRQSLVAAQTWVESVDVYLLQHQQVLKHWHAGDAEPASDHLVPTIGYMFDVDIPPGESEIFIRGKSLDPLTLPIALTSIEQARSQQIKTHVVLGIVYGFLLALVGFNMLLYISLKQIVALYYSFYIGCFVVMNLGYEGFAFSWFYPNSPQLQNYSTLFFMVLHGVCGLIFLSSYLPLSRKQSPLSRMLKLYVAVGIISSVIAIFLQLHLLMSWIAFSFVTLTTLIMIVVALLNVAASIDARYLLLAVSFSMFGLLTSALSVWGIISYTSWGFHGAEIGVVFEAMILATVLASRLRNIEQEKITAQYLATHDLLTRLHNRRAFEDIAGQYLQQAENHRKPVSFIMIDIDHFKAINDNYGHQVGDQALHQVAVLLSQQQRKNDILARWGGEEMAILLPDTALPQAVRYAEQLRALLECNPLTVAHKLIRITASFGVASCLIDIKQNCLETLFLEVDHMLYIAKDSGRNLVAPAVATVGISPPSVSTL